MKSLFLKTGLEPFFRQESARNRHNNLKEVWRVGLKFTKAARDIEAKANLYRPLLPYCANEIDAPAHRVTSYG